MFAQLEPFLLIHAVRVGLKRTSYFLGSILDIICRSWDSILGHGLPPGSNHGGHLLSWDSILGLGLLYELSHGDHR
jgi:hypothetical protein